ncbi:hypothetical protein RD792_017162 [Penstemon davidsonii]|uniref:Glycosyltransferase n=1 Tax=Penstemon davidsonii TaxID=160366 RepID=A0ABR0CL93_9LAMI|nr:hypothetical protein RD792_017162 [Penstemon davidsonii]
MEKEQNPKFKILMFPWLAHGHIFPFLELAKRLSKKNFTMYLCSTPINLDSIKKDQSNYSSSIELIELQIPESDELPQELHTTKNLPPNLLPILLQTFQKSSSSFKDIINSLKPDLLIYDFFQPWAPKYALSKGISSVNFVTSGATPCSFYHHMYTNGTSSNFISQAIYILDQEKIDVRARLQANLKDADEDFAFGNFTMSSEIILVKSCSEVEAKYIDYLSVLSKKRIVPTGPLIVFSNDQGDNSYIMDWLSGKGRHSTVYISFGSEYFLSKEQIEEIAKGLELCDVNFIWIIRFPSNEKLINKEDVLPKDFIERVKDRGLVLFEWAPQTKILGHLSVGGFVSHCGWSSITESMYFGVPVIGMPMKSEQPLNARLMVEVGVGVEVVRERNGQYLSKEIAKAIDKVIVDKAFCECLMYRAKDLSERIKEKEEQEGDEVAEQLMRLCMKNK